MLIIHCHAAMMPEHTAFAAILRPPPDVLIYAIHATAPIFAGVEAYATMLTLLLSHDDYFRFLFRYARKHFDFRHYFAALSLMSLHARFMRAMKPASMRSDKRPSALPDAIYAFARRPRHVVFRYSSFSLITPFSHCSIDADITPFLFFIFDAIADFSMKPCARLLMRVISSSFFFHLYYIDIFLHIFITYMAPYCFHIIIIFIIIFLYLFLSFYFHIYFIFILIYYIIFIDIFSISYIY